MVDESRSQIKNSQKKTLDVFKLLDEIKNKNSEEIKHGIKINDIIMVGKAGTTGRVIRVTAKDIIFVTFDKGGWSEAVTEPKHIIKINNILQKNNANIIFRKWLLKNNHKCFQLKDSFSTFYMCKYSGTTKRITIEKNERVFIDEEPE